MLLGNIPDYYVIGWLPVYNFSMGVVTAFFTTVLLWKNHKYAFPAAVTTLGLHSVVMLVLQVFYRNVVASDSIRAMTIRIIAWVIILALMIFHGRKNKNSVTVETSHLPDSA